MAAGAVEGAIVNPFEVVKVTMQANKASGKDVPSTWTVTKTIVSGAGFGLRGINKGITATVARNGVFNCGYFGFYYSVKEYLPGYDVSANHPVKLLSLLSIIGFSYRIFTSIWCRFCVRNISFLC